MTQTLFLGCHDTPASRENIQETLDRYHRRLGNTAPKGKIRHGDSLSWIDLTPKENDDLFVLLINGMAFSFWGSTDPRQKSDKRADEAFLAEGQHKFRFGWHKRSNPYQGLNPYGRGVLVFRDSKITNDNQLTEEDVAKGLDNSPNTTINIHWTGHGTGPSGTWSEGCQVLAGGTYLDPEGKLRDCRSFAAMSPDQIRANSTKRIKRGMAAYNVFTDLLLAYAPQPVDYLYYTLGRDDTLGEDGLNEQEGLSLLDKKIADFDLPRGLNFEEDAAT